MLTGSCTCMIFLALCMGVGWLGYMAAFSGRRVHSIDPYMVTYYDYIRVDFMYVGMAWVRPWLIAPGGDYIRLTLIW